MERNKLSIKNRWLENLWKSFLYVTEKNIWPAYISKINSNCEKQVIPLMVPNEEKEGWHYLAVTKLSTLLRGITSKHHFYYLNCLHAFQTENKLKFHEKLY